MKKPYKFNELSNVLCGNGCGKKLKMNFITRKGTNTVCYNCFRVAEKLRGNPIVTGKEVRTGKIKGRAKGMYVS